MANQKLRVIRSALVAFLLPVAASSQETLWITHGPILGRLSDHGVGVWARTADSKPFQVAYGQNSENLDQLSAVVSPVLERDNTGWVQIDGLRPDTKYFYQLVVPGEGRPQSSVHSFKTLPHPAGVRDPEHNPEGLFNFSFEFACGNSQPSNRDLPTFATMLRQLKDRIYFAIQNGDWLYEERRDYPLDRWAASLGARREALPRLLQIAPTIVGVWENYKLYLDRGKAMTEWHKEVPSFFTFDDHEILGDVNGAGTVGLRSRRAVFRDIGVQAWYDYLGWSNPVHNTQPIHFGRATLEAGSDILTDTAADFSKLDLAEASNLHVHWGGTTAGVNFYLRDDINHLDREGGKPSAGVYAIEEIIDPQRLRIRPAAKTGGDVSYSVGRLSYYRKRVSNADFFMLDTRSHRQLHDKDDPWKEGVSLLGEKQKRWLVEEMRRSDADFFFVVSSVNFMVPHVGPGAGGANKDEAWTAVPREREELIEFWDTLGKPVFVLTGDLHNSFAIKITDSVWEFASGPHNSGNHPVSSEGGRPPNGTFESRGRECEIRWSTYFLDEVSPRRLPVYCVVQVNNVIRSPTRQGGVRWVAYPKPQVVFQYYNGLSGELLYAESILARD